MKRMQKFISLGLVLCLVLSMVPVQVFSQDTFSDTTALEETVSGEITEETDVSRVELKEIGESFLDVNRESSEKSTISEENPSFNYEFVEEHVTEKAVDIGVVDSGTYGENLTWMLDGDGVLTISGTGRMSDHFGRPWQEFSDSITKIIITEGVSDIEPHAFNACRNVVEIIIPNTVLEIGKYAFYECVSLDTVSLPESLTYIGDSAFEECGKLTEISIPDSVTFIGNKAFAGCKSLTDITLSENLEGFQPWLFSGCEELNNITVPESVTYISTEAFRECKSLTEFAIPDNVSNIHPGAFSYCNNLLNFSVSENNQDYIVQNGVLLKMLENGKLELIQYPGRKEGYYFLPSNVITIGRSSFEGCSNLTGIIISENIINIDFYAFKNCNNLKEIVFEGNAPIFGLANDAPEYQLGTGTFFNVTATAYYPTNNATWTEDVMQDYGGDITWISGIPLQKEGTCGENLTWTLNYDGVLTISGTGKMTDFSIKSVPWYDYRNSITSVYINEGVTNIGKNAFYYCTDLNKISIPDSVTVISDYAFADCLNLGCISIPESLTNIGKGAFEYCYELDNVSIPEGVKSIGDFTFAGCTNLSSISLPKSITSIGNSAFYNCSNLTEISLPDNTTSIGLGAFEDCSGLRSIIIPKSVNSISNLAFYLCSKLTEIKFEGNACAIGENTFNKVTSTAYYPANNVTWTEAVMQDYGGDITWVPYDPETGGGGAETPDEDVDLHDTLDELTDEDYLAFSAIAYREFSNKGTIKENLSDIWGEKWSTSQNITYEQLCKYIANWEVFSLENYSVFNGFYAVAFTNKHKEEVVIAYRGSIPPNDWLDGIMTTWDAFCDWILNDIPIEVFNNLGPQFEDALHIYNHVAISYNKSKIRLTGHSLGGAWADAISAYSGCQAITFNAVSILDTLYKDEPEKMAKMFEGADRWNFVDHTNQYDLLAGMFEKYLSTEMKPYKAHKSMVPIPDSFISVSIGTVIDAAIGFKKGGPIGSVIGCVSGDVGKAIAGCHGLDSFAAVDSNGDVKLTEVVSSFYPADVITNYMLTANHSVDFGTRIANTIRKGLTILTSRTAYGGSEDDTILSSTRADKLIGGKGTDELDGSWGDDTYLYCWGDGTDIIHDVSGNDILKLLGVTSKVDISFAVDDSSDYVDVYCDGTLIAKISRENRASLLHSFVVEYGSDTANLSAYLIQRNYWAHIDIGCPVDIEILDTESNVVYIIKDGEPGNFYTDYGNFYVYEEEDGGYGKALDLMEGYTVKIVGVDTGTMDIAYQSVENGELTEAKTLTDIPVTSEYEAILEETEDGEILLHSAHTYDNNIDGTCNVCGIHRENVENRIVVHMFRMYNPNTGEHFYTGSEEERDNLIGHGWQYEGVGFTFPANTGAPVHRLFQPSTGEHLYTMDETEKAKLEAEGWNYEGIAFNSAYDTEAVQHRLHNPNATVGAFHFTFSLEEKQNLIDAGWEYQGIGWYSCWK